MTHSATHYVRFKGKFRDLIPQGWSFCKLFADDRRTYVKHVGEHDWAIFLYQKDRRVVLDNFGAYSWLFAEFLLNDDEMAKIPIGQSWFNFYIDTQELALVCSMSYEGFPYTDIWESAEAREAFHRRWRTIAITRELFDMCRDFVRSGDVEIVKLSP